MQQMIFIADFIACWTCFGHHYAHHQDLESIMQMVAACGIWCFGFHVVGMVWSWGLCGRLQTGHIIMYNTLELLMMGVMVPETCWASNKICNKNSSVASSWHFISTNVVALAAGFRPSVSQGSDNTVHNNQYIDIKHQSKHSYTGESCINLFLCYRFGRMLVSTKESVKLQ